MLKHLYFIIFLTFVTGLATGVYGFFSTREPADENPREEVGGAETGYEILATVYGGCERIGCASYRLMDDGTYLYLAPDGVRGYARYEDEVSPRQRERVEDLLMSAPLVRIEETIFVGTCPATYDGIAYRFDIRREGDTYSLDSCTQSLDDEELFIELIKYFDIMEATHRAL
jgi:hypothetical protein